MLQYSQAHTKCRKYLLVFTGYKKRTFFKIMCETLRSKTNMSHHHTTNRSVTWADVGTSHPLRLLTWS